MAQTDNRTANTRATVANTANTRTTDTNPENTHSIADYADVLKLLGDKTRLSILKILSQMDSCICHLAPMFDMSQSAISQHMKKLKDLDLVSEEPRKQWTFYSLNTVSEHYPLVKSILDQVPDDLIDLTQLEANIQEMVCS